MVCGRATIVWQLFLCKQTLFFMRTEIFFHKLRCMYNLFKIKTFKLIEKVIIVYKCEKTYLFSMCF